MNGVKDGPGIGGAVGETALSVVGSVWDSWSPVLQAVMPVVGALLVIVVAGGVVWLVRFWETGR